uniref:Uncharacterized protein n=1 Tax=Setaria digitata TaxID=48799 RepID=A0A915Q5X8_9BILA
MLVNVRNAATLAEKLPGLQGPTCHFVDGTGIDHTGGTGPYMIVNQQHIGSCDYLENSLSSSGSCVGGVDIVPCSKVTSSLVTSAKQQEANSVTSAFSIGNTDERDRDVDEDGIKLQQFYTSRRNITLHG